MERLHQGGVEEGIPGPSVAARRKAGDRQLQMEQATCHQYPGGDTVSPICYPTRTSGIPDCAGVDMQEIETCVDSGVCSWGVPRKPLKQIGGFPTLPGRRIAPGSTLFPGLPCPECGGWREGRQPCTLKAEDESCV